MLSLQMERKFFTIMKNIPCFEKFFERRSKEKMSKKTDHTSSFVCDICTLSAVICQIKLFQFELCIFKIVFLKKWLEVHQH